MDGQYLEDAYRALTESVRELAAANRVTYAASVKQRMATLLPRFDEGALGFRTFKSFILTAAERGLVVLSPTPGGDIEIRLPEATAEVSGGSLHRRIRHDVWKAFVDWAPGRRFWDRQEHRAFAVPELSAEPLLAEPTRYAPIEPVGRDVHIGWMREYADSLEDGETKAAVLELLAQTDGYFQFGNLLRSRHVASGWYALLSEKVGGLVASWAGEQGIADEMHETYTPFRSPRMAQVPARLSVGWQPQRRMQQGSSIDDSVRSRIHNAVDRMSVADLLRLAIPVEYLISDG